ncbi:MAG TPA: hypothetical protein PLI97_05300 [Fluviicola sp.]|nr:hypothetical protein [Fluviicola sp.]
MKGILFFALFVLASLGCTKEKFTGNYSFWYNEETSNDLAAFGIATLTMKVDGMVIGSQDSYKYSAKEPECGTGNFVYSTQMFKKENRTHKYEVFSESDSLIFSGTFLMTQGKCGSTQLKR